MSKLTKEQILLQLSSMNAPQDSIVLMHSSLRSVGEIEGGGQLLLDTLVEYFTEKGGLFCVPTHTTRNFFSGIEIALDMSDTVCDLGAFSDLALKDGRGIRSENPILSMVVFGDRKKAEQFIKDDAVVVTPTAPESCYGKLSSQNGYILLVGVGQEKNTYLHCVAEMLKIPDRMDDVEKPANVKRKNGEIVNRTMRLYRCSKSRDVSQRFPKYEVAFRYHKCITDGFIGNAPVQLCNAAKLKDTVELIFENSNGEDPLASENPIPPKWYCNK